MGIGGDILGHKEQEPQKKKTHKLDHHPKVELLLKVITKTMKMPAADWEETFAVFI